MTGSNTHEAVRDCIGHKIVGVLFDACPPSRPDLALGNKTLVFEDGTGMTFSNSGSFWREAKQEIEWAVAKQQRALDNAKRELEGVLQVAGELSNLEKTLTPKETK
jgi:hypothetical protein